MFKTIAKLLKCACTPKQEKIQYLEKRIRDYYFTIFINKLSPKNDTGVDIPLFILEKQARELAAKKTKEDLERVIEQCRINKCYMSALK